MDEATGEIRRIPLEIFVQGDKEPTYHETLEVRWRQEGGGGWGGTARGGMLGTAEPLSYRGGRGMGRGKALGENDASSRRRDDPHILHNSNSGPDLQRGNRTEAQRFLKRLLQSML